jgi:ABC-type nickel/cobalt efflux system permease component RcnA
VSSDTDDVVTRALDAADSTFDWLHNTVLRPVLVAGRTVASSLVLVTFGVVALVTLLLGITRLLDSYVFAAHRWLTPLSLGIVLVLIGLWLWRRRRPLPSSS